MNFNDQAVSAHPDDLRLIPLLRFFSHVQTELQRRAEQAGFDRVMPRSAFTQKLSDLLKDA